MKYVVFCISVLVLWIALTLDFGLSNILIGFSAAFITTLIFSRHYGNDEVKFLHPRRLFWLFVYLFVFAWECIKANIDVAYRVLHPDLPVKPGIVKVKLHCKSPLGRTILANSITMTPGTITVDMIGGFLYIHWIYVDSQNPEIYSKEISGRFERYIIKIFD